MSGMTSIIETRDLSYSYGDGTQALRNVSISLQAGRKVALVGPNGAGKSTLMLMMNGILRPSSGRFSLPAGHCSTMRQA